MKKIIPFALILCLLAGCGGGKQASYDTKETPDALFDSGAFSEDLEQIDTDIACEIYGIDEAQLDDCAVYLSTVAAEEIAVFKFKTEQQAEAAFPLLQQHQTAQTLAYGSYQPLEVPKLENAILSRRGATLLYVVANDAKAAQAALDNQ